MKKQELADDDGNSLPPIDPNSDVGRLTYLLEYCRIRGFRVGPRIQVGDVVLEVKDLRQTEGRSEPDEPSIWAAHGHDH